MKKTYSTCKIEVLSMAVADVLTLSVFDGTAQEHSGVIVDLDDYLKNL